MTITLNTKEFDEAVLLWLQSQGFSTDRFSISTKLTVGRGDLGAGTRMEVILDPISSIPTPPSLAEAMFMEEPVFPTLNKPSFSRGHADE